MGLMNLPPVQMEMLNQMGGPTRVILMTGAKDLVYDVKGRSLRLKLPPSLTRKRGNYIEIVLKRDDTYRIEYGIVTLRQHKVISVSDGIYANQLAEIFEATTGLLLR